MDSATRHQQYNGRFGNPVERFVATSESPLAVVRFCRAPGCKWYDTRRKGGGGRGNGFREGNRQRGRAIEHVKHCVHVGDALGNIAGAT